MTVRALGVNSARAHGLRVNKALREVALGCSSRRAPQLESTLALTCNKVPGADFIFVQVRMKVSLVYSCHPFTPTPFRKLPCFCALVQAHLGYLEKGNIWLVASKLLRLCLRPFGAPNDSAGHHGYPKHAITSPLATTVVVFSKARVVGTARVPRTLTARIPSTKR